MDKTANFRMAFQLFVIGLLLFNCIHIHAQEINDYRSRGSGNWAGATTWQIFNGTTWNNTSIPPNSSQGLITIRASHTVTLSTDRTVDQVLIEANAELSIANLISNFTITLVNGNGVDIQNNGTLTLSFNATLSGSGTIVNTGTFSMANGAISGVSAITNTGTITVTGTVTLANSVVVNNAILTLAGLTAILNLNATTCTNNGIINFSALVSDITGTGSGTLINVLGATLFNTSVLNTVRINPAGTTVTCINNGLIKGYGSITIRNPIANSGLIDPGNNDTPSLTINPALATGKTPTFNMEVSSVIAFDQIHFNNTDAASVNVSGVTLTVTDNSNSAIGTIYTIVTSTVPIAGNFAVVNVPPTLGNIVYNANSITIQKIATQNRYTWIGGNSSWTTASNWFPTRNSPASSDILIFDGGTQTVSNVPTQSINGLIIRNNATVTLAPSTTSQTLSIGNTLMNYLGVEPGSTLNIRDNAAALLNIAINNGSRANIGGVVHMQTGTFNINNNLLQLHTSATPLTRTSGQFSFSGNATLEFGTLANPSGPALTLANNIFTAPPTIDKITLQRINGVVLGNQSITVNQAILITGNLNTNAAGRIRFTTTASNPTETQLSKIIGYADMLPRAVGTNAANFLGLQLAAGADVGTVSLTRISGSTGINTFNGLSSIATTWVATTTLDPTAGRMVSFFWLEAFDHVANTALNFQSYHFDSGPGWLDVGALAPLSSTLNPRSTTPVLTLKLTGSWTLADQNNVLPITVSYFEAKQEGNFMELNWKTASEENSNQFDVQRLTPDMETFETLGTVQAAGSSKEILRYRFTDNNPVPGQNYYRLKLIDLDGSVAFSDVVTAQYAPALNLTLFPNPNNGQQLTLIFPDRPEATIFINDIYQHEHYKAHVKGSTHTIDLSLLALPVGVYLARYCSNGQMITKRLVIH